MRRTGGEGRRKTLRRPPVLRRRGFYCRCLSGLPSWKGKVRRRAKAGRSWSYNPARTRTTPGGSYNPGAAPKVVLVAPDCPPGWAWAGPPAGDVRGGCGFGRRGAKRGGGAASPPAARFGLVFGAGASTSVSICRLGGRSGSGWVGGAGPAWGPGRWVLVGDGWHPFGEVVAPTDRGSMACSRSTKGGRGCCRRVSLYPPNCCGVWSTRSTGRGPRRKPGPIAGVVLAGAPRWVSPGAVRWDRRRRNRGCPAKVGVGKTRGVLPKRFVLVSGRPRERAVGRARDGPATSVPCGVDGTKSPRDTAARPVRGLADDMAGATVGYGVCRFRVLVPTGAAVAAGCVGQV